MQRKVTVAIIGMGNRGGEAYPNYMKYCPDEMEITAVADPRPDRRALGWQRYNVPPERCYASGEELLQQPQLAEVLIIANQDRDHVRMALPALEKGYHLLLEKPISPSLEECIALREKAHECNRMVVVCHVLRYTQFYSKLKELLDSGAIGQLQSIAATENIGYYHFAHSYVRGNWRRADETSPLILAKTCHDMDILRWLAGKPCLRVSSFGSLSWFTKEHAPEGSAPRCLDCPVKADCPYDAEKIYITHKPAGYRQGVRGWPLTVLCVDPTEEKLYEALRTGPYGRCVYACDNTVADHQTVNLEFEGGITASFSVSAFTERCYRTIKLCGSIGELEGSMEDHAITLRRFGCPEEKIVLDPTNDKFAGHGGGDSRMVEALLQMVANGGGEALTSVDASVESHVMALAAERSRLHGGTAVTLKEFEKQAISTSR